MGKIVQQLTRFRPPVQRAGMETVKAMLRSLCRKMVVDQQRAKFGFVNQQNLNMLFLGNPGTGKTSMARVVAKLLKYMGILKKGHIVEVSRKDLVAEYSGQSAVKTMAKVEEATGGVLFVDEAYSLKHMESKDSFGQEVSGGRNRSQDLAFLSHYVGFDARFHAGCAQE